MIFDKKFNVSRLVAGSPRGKLRIGCVSGDPGKESAFVTSEYALVYIWKGHGVYYDRFGEHPFEPGFIFQRFPGREHDVLYASPCERSYIAVPAQVYELIRMTSSVSLSKPTLDAGLRPSLLEEFEVLARELKEQDESSLTLTLMKMQEFIVELLFSCIENEASDPCSLAIDKACRILNSSFSEKQSMPEISRLVNMGYSSFRKKFHEKTGFSPGEYRLRKKIEKAMDMLGNLNIPVKQIAAELGYPDIYSFSAQFSKYAGVSPRKFRYLED
jgi:AraC-like DNA-binding protein